MKRVLILCTGNSCRSQMAEAIWNDLGDGRWQAFSAGTNPAGYVHPLALLALAERSPAAAPRHLHSKSINEFTGQKFDLAVTVCDGARDSCPNFPAASALHWSICDPAVALGNEAERLNVFRRVRDQIAWQIKGFLGQEAAADEPPRRDLALSLEEHDDVGRLIDAAFEEDLGGGLDATSEAVVPAEINGTASFIARSAGIVSGLAVCAEVIRRRCDDVQWQPLAFDGDAVFAGQTLGVLAGKARDILKVERTCLNFLGRLSGIATITGRYVEKLRGTTSALCDTRKTTPGWRRLEKYAVRCGGGQNHRMGLFDAILIKDNHLAVLRMLGDEPEIAVRRAIREAREWIDRKQHLVPRGARTTVQIEIDRLEMLRAALEERPDMILLDNMSVETVRQAVAMRRQFNPQVLMEASGGITLETIRAIAETGVDRISVGAVTHSAPNFDIGLDWQIDLTKQESD